MRKDTNTQTRYASKYFTYEEMESPDSPGSGQYVSDELFRRLDALREKVGRPIRVTSGFRTQNHNKKVGGSPQSSHTKGLAVDLSCRTSHERFLLLNAAIHTGFSRIGIGKTFIHLDIDPSKSDEVMWDYYK